MAKLPPLTDRQQQTLDFIQDRIKAWGYPPTIREIGEHLGIKSTNGVADHLKALKRKGYLVQEDMKSRTLRPTRDKKGGAVRAVMNMVGVRDVLTKSYGSNNPINLVKATFDGLERLRDKATIEKLRGVTLE